MPPLIAVLLLGAGAYVGLRLGRHLLNSALRRAGLRDATEPVKSESRAAKNLGSLELDPESGIYHPARRD